MFSALGGMLSSALGSIGSWGSSALSWLGSNGSALSGAGSLLSGVTSLGSWLTTPSTGKQIDMQLNAQKDLYAFQNALNVNNYQHRHQWEVDDLKAAGLNPILSANSGASVGSANGMLGNSVSSAEQTKAMKAQNAIQAFSVMADSVNKIANAKYMNELAQNQPFVRDQLAMDWMRGLVGIDLLGAQTREANSASLMHSAYANMSNVERSYMEKFGSKQVPNTTAGLVGSALHGIGNDISDGLKWFSKQKFPSFTHETGSSMHTGVTRNHLWK